MGNVYSKPIMMKDASLFFLPVSLFPVAIAQYELLLELQRSRNVFGL